MVAGHPHARHHHHLYVKVATAEWDNDAKSRELTISLLTYIRASLGVLGQMGVRVRVERVRSEDIDAPGVVDALARQGVRRLPALVTPNGVYTGLEEIRGLYERNIDEFMGRRPPPRGDDGDYPGEDGTASSGDPLEDFFKKEIAGGGDDDEDDALGDAAGNLSDAHRRMMEQRETSSASNRPKKHRGGAAPPAPRPPRVDNVRRSSPPGRAEEQHDDDEISSTIRRLGADIPTGVYHQPKVPLGASGAPGPAGGDPDDDDDANNPNDDLMERAYWDSHAQED